ncbi:TIGR03364 family FAD-dependent oxidoreductase [Alienimonas chondri]|uniref:tRNA 5-methylaminomethyl-2-thiouridine biosynthesis bifunctional protein MnmC n=1 Tax=Alienimonas chondri TaxID=2681879 RepID=A0ABX1VBF7_9PLAN|nr:TIGR03364 family FAD-dependent oxidoreductase [Alienimonas chondri]NNJ25408.1 tRNA 5-methylaminomethyl-2-thiouridine biosynthesis bifunctional protein MnmC [Alienimonas chondri]
MTVPPPEASSSARRAPRDSYDVAVVGGGIAGMGAALAAAKRGESVVLFERTPKARGASVRNFGMIWPVGQPAGRARSLALRSRAIWKELAQAGDFDCTPCGSLFAAYREDEAAVMREFLSGSAAEGLDAEWLSPEETLKRSPRANPEGLIGGLFSAAECGVHPPSAIAGVRAALEQQYGVTFREGTPVVAVDSGRVTIAGGETIAAQRIIVAGGAEAASLFPAEHAAEAMVKCKLQMLETAPLEGGGEAGAEPFGPHLAGGLTLRHYKSFAACPSQPALAARVAAEAPELDRFGVHVMAAETPWGSLILGDSHEYGDDVSPFDSAEIDALILRELRPMLSLPSWEIARRWHGVYLKHPTELFLAKPVAEGVTLFNGFGGNGMTLALGAAETLFEPPAVASTTGDEPTDEIPIPSVAPRSDAPRSESMTSAPQTALTGFPR